MKVSLLTRLTLAVSWKSVPRLAGVAELVDAPDSKSGFRKEVSVQVRPPVPFFKFVHYVKNRIKQIPDNNKIARLVKVSSMWACC